MLSGKWWVKLCNFFHCDVHTHNPSHQAVIATLEKIAFDIEEKMGPRLPLSNKNGIQKGQIYFGRCGILPVSTF